MKRMRCFGNISWLVLFYLVVLGSTLCVCEGGARASLFGDTQSEDLPNSDEVDMPFIRPKQMEMEGSVWGLVWQSRAV